MARLVLRLLVNAMWSLTRIPRAESVSAIIRVSSRCRPKHCKLCLRLVRCRPLDRLFPVDRLSRSPRSLVIPVRNRVRFVGAMQPGRVSIRCLIGRLVRVVVPLLPMKV